MTTNFNIDNNLGPKKITADTTKVEPSEKKRPLPPVDKKEKEERFKKFLSEDEQKKALEDQPLVVGTSPLALMSGAVSIDTIKEGTHTTRTDEELNIVTSLKKQPKIKEEFIAASLLPPQSRPIEGAFIEAPKPTTDTQATLRTLVDSCVKTLSEEIDPTKTTIRVELKLPIFEGATLEITQYKSAQKEFSLSFHNLTNPEARALITTHEQTLRTQLLDRGYTLQLVTIEPKLEVTSHGSTYEGAAKERGQDHGQQQQEQPFGRSPR